MRRKIVLSLVLLFGLFAVGAVAASWYVSVATQQLRRLVDLHEVEGLRRNLVISVQTVQGDLYTAHTALARKLDAIVANVENLDSAAGECASCHHRPEIEAELAEIQNLIEEYKRALSYYITASANKERITRIEFEAASIGNQILQRTEEMSARASATLDEITESAISRINNVRVILLVTLVLMIGLGVAVSSLLVRSVTRPIKRLVGATRTFASGDFGHRIEDVEEAEFGELARHFNDMGIALERSYERLRSANEELQREIRERREAEKQSDELQTQLLHAQKMEALGTLSAGIAHEFGNTLQIVQSCIEKLASRASAEGPGRRELETIRDAAQRGADLTRRLLTFSSKVDSGRLPVDVNETVRHVARILEQTLPETIEIQLGLTEDMVLVDANPAQIEQVLLNLALNARDAMPDGGRVRVETARDETEGHEAQGAAPGEAAEWVLLRVSDSGHGMDAETLKQIFDPFFTTKEAGVGTGLGLATVYDIVKDYGGEISCESAVGRGTVFEIRLPALSGHHEVAAAVGAAAKPLRRGDETILFVDDETAMLEVMRDNLQDQGYVVHTAASGESAVEFFVERGSEIDLVILDIGMPGMGGRACLKKLLEIDPNARVIISTGYGARSDQKEMMAIGARGFLAKPYQLSDILNEIETVLSDRTSD